MGLLANTMSSRLAAYVDRHQPTRVLVGGLPTGFLQALAEDWDPSRKLLIVTEKPHEFSASLQSFLCRPDDLTAERQHAWVALVCAESSRGIQESIRSTGAGTVREVWSSGFPWKPCSIPGVTWEEVLEEFVVALGLSAEKSAAIKCIQQFRRELTGEVDAAKELFTALDAITVGPIKYDELSYHLGIPSHSADEPLRATKSKDAVLALADAFLKKFHEEGSEEAVAQLIAANDEVNSSDATLGAKVSAALNHFADKFRLLSPAESSTAVRAWSSVFAGHKDHWATLGVAELRKLLEKQPTRGKITINGIASGQGMDVFQVGGNYIAVRDLNVEPPAISVCFSFNTALTEQADASSSLWKLFSVYNRKIYQVEAPLPAGGGPFMRDIRLPQGSRARSVMGKHLVKLFVGEDSSSERATSVAITLWECCRDYPFIAATSSGTSRPGKRARTIATDGGVTFESEQELTLKSQGMVSLRCFVFDLQRDLCIVRPGSSIAESVSNIEQIPSRRCHKFDVSLDVSDGDEMVVEWLNSQNEQHRATVLFEVEEGSAETTDSLSTLLCRAHGGFGKKTVVGYLTDICSGTSVGASDLPINANTRLISYFERRQQDVIKGWRPILLDAANRIDVQRLLGGDSDHFVSSTSLRLHHQATAWRNEIDGQRGDQPIPETVASYISARAQVIKSLQAQFHLSSGETLEEINIARKAYVGTLDEQLLVEYLERFTRVMTDLESGSFSGSWKWIAASLDALLVFEYETSSPSVQLLGPFHPFSLARRYFLQATLGRRLISGSECPVAQALDHAESLAVGRIVNAQLQPSEAISFSSGDHHWLMLYRQSSEGDLPNASLQSWLRHAGFSPRIGPLAMDTEVLPQTLRQYVLAYPARQTIRLSLDDCSQSTYEVLADELSAPSEVDDSARRKLRFLISGQVIVFDRLAKIDEINGDTLSFDPDLPLRWHHKAPHASLPIDIATLERSSSVYFNHRKEKGGAYSRFMPTARRFLTEASSNGLEVASALGAPSGATPLADAFLTAMSVYEPDSAMLTWGTSWASQMSPQVNWNLCSASQVDPRLFIDYVISNPGTALWTYRLFSVEDGATPEFGRGHFLIAKVSPSLANGLRAQLAATSIPLDPNTLLTDLAKAGLTLGDEFLRAGRAAEGALGQYLVQRLVWQPEGEDAPLPHWEINKSTSDEVVSAGFLLQIDPFTKVLDALYGAQTNVLDEPDDSGQRSDLISFHLKFCAQDLWVKPVVFESKYLTTGQTNVRKAISQAESTARKLDHLLEFCIVDPNKQEDPYLAQPERMLLAEMIHLGLRLASISYTGSADSWHGFERKVLTKILSGDYKRDDSGAAVLIHSPSKTDNQLVSGTPHAYVSFADASSAIIGQPTAIYAAVQKDIADLVRHNCGKGFSSGVPTQTQNSDEYEISQQAMVLREDADSSPPISNGEQGQASHGQSLERGDRALIQQAHDRFNKAFVGFIGNKAATEKLRDDLVDALIKSPPYLQSAYLLTGNPSTGKTTLANRIAALLGVTFVKLVGTNLKSASELIDQVDNAFDAAGVQPSVTKQGSQGLPEIEYPACLIFIDEIHLVNKKAQEDLLTMTEANDRYVRLRDRICRFPKATFIGATTRDSELDRALRTRFGNPINLRDYNSEEVALMLTVKDANFAEWGEDVRIGIARLARNQPREAERLARKLQRKLSVALEHLSLNEALERLRLEEGLDRYGLDKQAWAVLLGLARERKSLGKDALAQQLGIVDEEKLVSEIIPALRAMGLVEQVAGGQKITDRGMNYLRNEEKPEVELSP